MNASSISRLEPVPLRELWPHEARDFTVWLADNLDLLSETLGFPLTLIQTEVAAGTFSADILADADGDRIAVIENQLEGTDHDQLGKLITYLSNLDAKVAIWITSSPRPEHEHAIHWLNEWLPQDVAFYLVKIEAFRIDNSPAAPLLSIVAGPSQAAQEAGATKKELAERQLLRQEFWTKLLECASPKTDLHARVSPSTENWISASAGRSGLGFNYVVRLHDARVELYIDGSTAAENKRIFDTLFTQKETIEREFGGPLDWQRLDDRKASRICYALPDGGLMDREQWQEIQDRMIDAMLRLQKALKSRIGELQLL
jgi:hypothetical protein